MDNNNNLNDFFSSESYEYLKKTAQEINETCQQSFSRLAEAFNNSVNKQSYISFTHSINSLSKRIEKSFAPIINKLDAPDGAFNAINNSLQIAQKPIFNELNSFSHYYFTFENRERPIIEVSNNTIQLAKEANFDLDKYSVDKPATPNKRNLDISVIFAILSFLIEMFFGTVGLVDMYQSDQQMEEINERLNEINQKEDKTNQLLLAILEELTDEHLPNETKYLLFV